MKRLEKYVALCLLAALPVVSACSDSEEPKKPSTEIVQVDIYKSDVDAFQLKDQYKITYDGKNRISSVHAKFNSQEIAYTYGEKSISYRWEGTNSSTGVFVNYFEAELRNGRVQVGSVDNKEGVDAVTKIYNYSYHYTSQGYIQDATYGASQLFNYEWSNTGLVVKGRPSVYDAQYSYSDVTNDYSLDLNVLPLLVDARTDVQLAMNMYAQLAGVLGTRSSYFLQDADYEYDYLFDAEGRLVQIVQTPSSLKPERQDTYWFMIHYAD
ncbi:MAG: hypothetical protein IKY31_04020 [Bacteroidaceae bacterium]|nr:hypothetical protein [Bacteroidaceae bacterium]